jgi:hypothetical protein
VGDVVGHLGTAYATRVVQSNVTAPAAGMTTNSNSWIPAWTATAFTATQLAYYNNIFYIANNAVGAGLTPSVPNTNGQNWMPLWSNVTYNASNHVYNNGEVWFNAVSTSAPPGANTTGVTSGWMQLWRNGGAFAQGQYVASSNNAYYAYDSNGLSTTMPSVVNTTGRGWIVVGLPGTPSPGQYGLDTGVVLKHYAVLNNGSNWINAWQSNIAYNPGSVIGLSGFAYSNITGIASNVIPSGPPSNSNSWIPFWRNTTSYNSGVYIAHQSNVYTAIEGTTSANTPAASNTTGRYWIPLWRNTGGAYTVSNFVYNADETYISATATSNVPVVNSNGLRDWVTVWKSGNGYVQGEYIYSSTNNAYFVAYDSNGLSTTSPSTSNTVLSGWVLVGLPPTPVVGNVAIVGSNVQSFVNINTSNIWLNAWTSNNNGFNKGDVVAHQGRAYATFKSVASNLAPVLNKNDLNRWIPVWTSNDTYNSLEYTYHNNKFYASVSVLNSNTIPVTAASNMTAWVPIWESNASINSNLYVYGERSMAFYRSTSNLGSNQNILPENDFEEVAWKMCSVPLVGPISLRRTRGIIFTRL